MQACSSGVGRTLPYRMSGTCAPHPCRTRRTRVRGVWLSLSGRACGGRTTGGGASCLDPRVPPASCPAVAQASRLHLVPPWREGILPPIPRASRPVQAPQGFFFSGHGGLRVLRALRGEGGVSSHHEGHQRFTCVRAGLPRTREWIEPRRTRKAQRGTPPGRGGVTSGLPAGQQPKAHHSGAPAPSQTLFVLAAGTSGIINKKGGDPAWEVGLAP